MPTQERLQKILAAAGRGSRRACEELIRAGRVAVNGQVAQLGQKADPARDRITLDGKPVQIRKATTYIALYKPVGVVSTAHDPEGRQAVVDLVPSEARLYPVGRLDMLSEGLILLTDDGELALRLTHPRYEHPKEYRVHVAGRVTEEAIAQWQEGVLLEEGPTAPADISVLRYERRSTWLRVVLYEGRKREIRRVVELLGYSVQKLVRTRIGPIRLGQLKPGEWRYLTAQELAELRKIKKRS
jgi:23S rRNA pseudouridine2605 synthase